MMKYLKYYKTEAKDDKDENMNDSFNKINTLLMIILFSYI